MAKRGPKPKATPPEGRSVVFSSRMSPDLKADLEKAAALRGRTLSDEIQMRLKRTFTEDKEIANNFGDRQTYMMMRTVALAIQWSMVGSQGGRRGSWLDDPAWFDLAVKTINRLLEAVRPEGDTRPQFTGTASDDDVEALLDYNQKAIASAMWLEVQAADPSLPRHVGTHHDHVVRLIKEEIGDVAARSKTSLADLTGMADEIKAARKNPK